MVPNLRLIGLYDRGTLRWVRLCLTIPVLAHMRGRYDYRPELLDTEGPWWNKIQNELNSRIARSKRKPRNVQIQQLIDQINLIIIEKWEQRQSETDTNDGGVDPGAR